MVDVFISYAHEDADRVVPLVSMLEGQGFSVWWDRHIAPGDNFENQIEGKIEECSSVILALTRGATDSAWVRAEAAAAQDLGKVIPVLLDDVPIPLSLRAVQAAKLIDWSGSINGEAAKLLSTVASHVRQSQRPFIGRDDTVRMLHGALRDTLSGQGSVILVSGEPGIGKTRCAEEFAQEAEDHGALVLWGRCSEQRGAPAYWPWVQVLRDYADAYSEDELRVMLEGIAEAAVALVPEIGTRLGISSASSSEVDSGERFRFLDSIARLLFRASAELPLVVIIDDLHWADASTLALLEYVVGGLRNQRLLVLGTYRDVEVTRTSPLKSSLGELTRAKNASRIKLGGLDDKDTGALSAALAGIQLPKHVLDAIYRQTDGNPLFISEIADSISRERHVARDVIEVDVPEGVREAIGRRLNRLPADCSEALSVASVIGRDFDARVLAKAMAVDLAACMNRLSAAEEVGIIVPYGDSPTTFRFAHALIREALFDEQQTIDRLQWHERIAAAIAAIHGAQLEAVLSELAHHYCEAAVLGHFEIAIDYSIRAAEQAASLFAFEDAARLYGEAVRVMLANGSANTAQIPRAYFEQGKLWEALGRYDQAVHCHLECIGRAREQGDAALFAESAMRLVFIANDSAALHAAPLMKEALRMLPDDAPQRAAVKAYLAFALRGTGDFHRISDLGAEAVALARRSGDKSVLALALQLTIMALRGFPQALAKRVELGREMVEVGPSLPNPQDRLHCWYYQLLNLIEACSMEEFAALFERYQRAATSQHVPQHEYYVMNLEIMLRLMRGEWSGLEARIEQALEQGEKLVREGADGVYGMQMFMLNRELGRLPAMAPLIRRMLENPHSRLWEPGLMLMCCEAGLLKEARASFESLSVDRFSGVPRDDLWVTCMIFCAEACVQLDAREHAGVLYELLLPASGHSANHSNGICFGAIDGYLGALAATMGETEIARGHFERAIDTNRTLAAWPTLARNQARLGRMLVASDEMGDEKKGRKLLEDARRLAARFQMNGLENEIETIVADGTGTQPDGLSPREIDVLKLIAIGRSNKDISKVLSISLSTVATHVRSILSKTDCANRTEAAAYALRSEIT
jgi:DNA-binding CsgD family transcriptional regulator